MVYFGRIKNGMIVLDSDARLPEGMAVRVDLVEPTGNGSVPETGSVWDDLLELAGTAEGLPPDLSRQHDHYLYGKPKR